MACTCTTLTEFALSCTPTVGGIASVTIDGVAIQTLPDTSTYNAAMTYEKQHNLKYWTTDVNLNIGALSAAARTLVEALPCPVGRAIVLNMNSGHTVTVNDAFIQTATFTPGASKTEGGDGVLVFQAITKEAPSVADPNE